ncbi:MAG: enoyl-CoA hydratase-related protein [Pseudomonadota bacterium]
MTVERRRDGDLEIVTLNRPEALNALSFEILRQLHATFTDIKTSDARALVVTGAGDKSFCAGADIKELLGRDLMAQKRGTQLGQSVMTLVSELPMPSIAVVNGYAFGGGMELAMGCTFRLATPNAKFGQPEIKLGIIPGYGGTQRLPRLIGESRALDLIMTGRTVDAEEALSMGLVNRIIEGDSLEAAKAFAKAFTGFSLPALEFAREAVMRAQDVPVREGLMIETDLVTLSFQTADAEEGMSAFAEKRKPVFKDA